MSARSEAFLMEHMKEHFHQDLQTNLMYLMRVHPRISVKFGCDACGEETVAQ